MAASNVLMRFDIRRRAGAAKSEMISDLRQQNFKFVTVTNLNNRLPWLEANRDVLGFDSPQTAQKLMQAARKCRVDAAFDEPTALQISREIWGNGSWLQWLDREFGWTEQDCAQFHACV